MSRAEQALLGLLALSAVFAIPAMLGQWEAASRASAALGGMDREARAAAVDHPAVEVAREIADIVPEYGCVTVLAYAGPAAVDYYNARLDYLLYPRRVQVFADAAAEAEDCEHVAVFRDTEQNLAAEPFAGQWDSEALAARVDRLEVVGAGGFVRLYREYQ